MLAPPSLLLFILNGNGRENKMAAMCMLQHGGLEGGGVHAPAWTGGGSSEDDGGRVEEAGGRGTCMGRCRIVTLQGITAEIKTLTKY